MTLQEIKISTGNKQLFIAEVKTQSPFGFVSKYNWDDLFKIANEYGDIISIHVDSRWGGDLELVKKARDLTQKPILAKGFIQTAYDVEIARHHGANYTLQVGEEVPYYKRNYREEMLEKLFYEPLNKEHLYYIFKEKTNIVINKRNPQTGQTYNNYWERFYKKEDDFIKDIKLYNIFGGNVIQASGIKNKQDICDWAKGFIIGENLLEFVKTL